MVIGRVSRSMEALATAVNHIMKVNAGEHSSSSNNNRQPQ